MKRQSRPFAVEIKRSRRSTPLNDSSTPEYVQKNSDFFKPSVQARLDLENASGTENSEAIEIPAFLQKAKAGDGPQAPAKSPPDYPPSLWKRGEIADEKPVAPRILPSLSTADAELKSIETKPAGTPRARLNRPAPLTFPELSDTNSGHSTAVALEKPAEINAAGVSSCAPQINQLAADVTCSAPNPTQKRRIHRFLKVDRENLASLPPGQRWKRRMLTRAR